MTRVIPSLQQAHDAFIALEEEADLWSLEAFGQRYWHNIRYDVWSAVQQSLGLLGPRQGSWRDRPPSTWLKLRPGHILHAARRYSWRDVGPADLLVFNHPRHVFGDSSWYCAYSDPLLRDLSESRWVIEQGFKGQHYTPNETRGLKYIEWAKQLEYARFALRDGWRGGFLKARDRRDIARWAEILQGELGGGPDAAKAALLVRSAVRRKVALGSLYERLLDRVQPKVVIQVVHYSFRNLVMTPIARARGIPVVELQHGFIGPTHLAYNMAPGRLPEAYPDYILLFGRFWRDISPALPLPTERTPAIGFAHLEAVRGAEPARPASGPATLLFVSQKSIGEALSRVAAELAKRVDPERYRVVYRLHPGEAEGWQRRYPHLVEAPLTVADPTSGDIYLQFARSHVLVGVYSTALFEGLAFGLPTFVMAISGYEDMQALVDRGLATLASGVDELIELLESAPQPANTKVLSSIWQPRARENFRGFLSALIASGESDARR